MKTSAAEPLIQIAVGGALFDFEEVHRGLPGETGVPRFKADYVDDRRVKIEESQRIL